MKKGISSTIVILIIGIVILNMFFDNSLEFTSFFSFIPFVGFIYIVKSIATARKREQNGQSSDDAKEDFINRFLKEKTNQNNINKTPTRPNAKEEARGGNTSKRCRKCNSLISIDDRYCPECGEPQKNTIICEYCGHENPASNALCEKCNGFL